MTNFEMRPQTPENTNTIDPEKWEEYNDYVCESIGGEEVCVDGSIIKEVTHVGHVNLLIQAGYIPQEDANLDSKLTPPDFNSDVKNSKEELEHIEQYPNNYFEWEGNKRVLRFPVKPQEEYILAVDFPDIMIDTSKHPAADEDAEESLKPLRVSYNGKWKGCVGRHVKITLNSKDKKLSPENILYKIASKSGKLQEFLASAEAERTNYNLGILAGATCKWTIVYKKTPGENGNVYHNISIKEPSAIEPVKVGNKVVATVEDQITECPIPFTGILLEQDSYQDEDLRMIRKEFRSLLEKGVAYQPSPIKYPNKWLGVDWKDTELCKALKAYYDKLKNEGQDSSESEDSVVPEEDNIDNEDLSTENVTTEDSDAPDDDIPL